MNDFLQNTPDLWKKKLPLPTEESHKHNRGHLLIAGSRFMTGAPRLVARGARRMGCGMVYLAVPNEVVSIYKNDNPGNIVIRCEDSSAFRNVIATTEADAIVVGPGLKETDIARDIVQRALRSSIPTVIDAGGIGVFKQKPERLKKAITGIAVVTPHMGEYKKLFGSDEKSNAERAVFVAQYLKATVVLKGANTYIASPDGRLAQTEKASSWLATAGTGDVLSGQIGALLSQNMDPFEAACAGVWFHKKAADLFGPALIAEDIPDLLPKVWQKLL